MQERRGIAASGLRHVFLILLLFAVIGPNMAAGSSAGAISYLDKRYQQATAFYNGISFDQKRRLERDNWLAAANGFRQVYQIAPVGSYAPRCLYMLGLIYGRMYQDFHTAPDLDESISYYQDLSVIFPKHSLADDALLALAEITRKYQQDHQQAIKMLARIVAVYPKGDMAPRAGSILRNLKKGTLTATAVDPVSARLSRAVRYWSTDTYARVVIETSAPVKFRKTLLAGKEGQPRHLNVDLVNCLVNADFQGIKRVDNGLLRLIRTSRLDRKAVRVALEIDSVDKYKIFTLAAPNRVVIDVTGNARRLPAPLTANAVKVPRRSLSLVEQFGLGVRTIVIDPGHGGRDPGAIGGTGLLEKDVVLKVAKKVAAMMARETSYEVILTRDRDVFIPLEERTAIANTRGADLFVSLHANSAPNKKARGVETYFLSLATSRDEMRAAARENSSSNSQLSDLQSILEDLMQNTKIEESSHLAGVVQSQMVRGLGRNYQVRDLGVKKAPFIVLIGARMPAILMEIAFLSNREDEALLRNSSYLDSVARQIMAGIVAYANDLNET